MIFSLIRALNLTRADSDVFVLIAGIFEAIKEKSVNAINMSAGIP